MTNYMIDDDRQYRPTPKGFKRYYTPQELMNAIKYEDHIGMITIDNDLGDHSKPEIDGQVIVKWMVRLGINAEAYNIHSANVIAVANMVSYLRSAMKAGVIANAPITVYPIKELIERMN